MEHEQPQKIVNWEETEKGKNYNLLIPSEILRMKLLFNEKIVLGLIYTSVKKNGQLKMNNKRISKYLCLNENTVSTTLKNLVEQKLIDKIDKGYILNEKLVQQIDLNKGRTILLPFEVFNSKLNAGAKILWGEYNSLSKGKREYYASRQYTSERLNMGESSISSWTTLLYDNDFIVKNELYSGYMYKKKKVVTKIFERVKENDYNEEIED